MGTECASRAQFYEGRLWLSNLSTCRLPSILACSVEPNNESCKQYSRQLRKVAADVSHPRNARARLEHKQVNHAQCDHPSGRNRPSGEDGTPLCHFEHKPRRFGLRRRQTFEQLDTTNQRRWPRLADTVDKTIMLYAIVLSAVSLHRTSTAMRPPRTATSACRAATSFRSCASAAPKSGQPSTSRSRLASTRKSAVRGMSLGLASDERHRAC